MRPLLISVKLKVIEPDHSIVEILYSGSHDLEGIELQGVDSGLSWLKGESLDLIPLETKADEVIYAIEIALESRCEFRARGYIGEEDHWEEGDNHVLQRDASGSISIGGLDEHRIAFQAELPPETFPELYSIKIQELTVEQTSFEVVYRVSPRYQGIELLGSDAGLSTTEGSSINLETLKTEGQWKYYHVILSIFDSCEFKARAYLDDESIWERITDNHQVSRQYDGMLSLSSQVKLIDGHSFIGSFPEEYVPVLKGVVMQKPQEDYTLVELTYTASSELDGVEIMGSGSGLSDVELESLIAEKQSQNAGLTTYVAIVKLVGACKFLGRGYKDKSTFYEENEAHMLIRLDNGAIELKTDEFVLANIRYVNNPPADPHPTLLEAWQRVSGEDSRPTSIFQLTIDTAIIMQHLQENPKEQQYIDIIPHVIRVLKDEGRQHRSKKIDELVRPALSILFNMYTSAKGFVEEDIRILTGGWEKARYPNFFEKLITQAIELEEDEAIGTEEDKQERFKSLLELS